MKELARQWFLFFLFAMCSCAPSHKYYPTPEEVTFRYKIHHNLTASEAYNRIEVWIAENYNNASAVTQLKRKEDGLIILRPIVQYVYARLVDMRSYYTFRISVYPSRVELYFKVDPELSSQRLPPRSVLPQIKSYFRHIVTEITQVIEGSLEQSY